MMNGSIKKMTGNPGWVLDQKLSPGHHWSGDFFELTKIRLSLYIALSSVFGHVLSQNRFTMDSLGLGGIVLLLTAGVATMNHVQDRHFDLWFARTRHRSLVQKRISPLVAGFIALSLIFAGLGGLFVCFSGLGPVGLGLLALLCYNGFYTPLKKRSLGAIVPGGLCGMLPPAIGWMAVPGPVADASGIFIVMLIFGLWQIPHVFIILLKQLPGELEAAPYPFFTSILSRKAIKCQVVIWTSLYSLGILLFLLKGWVHSLGLSLFLGALALVLPLSIAALLGWKRSPHSLVFSLLVINLFMLFFMGVGILDRIWLIK
ncbi:MAG: UbiA family prenyltransferase [Desulfobacteraceae bacterium]|nr:UbiA family prenyltransferase [Desulfobacteraceae bacterium]